jgi:streptogramin lyase
MFSRFMPPILINASRDHRTFQGRRTRSARRPTDRARARFRLEGLEDRCLLTGISSITEFPLSSSAVSLTGITAGPDGNIWFTDRGANAIGEISPTTHAISLFTVPTANCWPYGIAAGSDGNLWFTEEATNKIGEINPTTHAITEFTLPSASNDGDKLAFPRGITAGPDGNIWFAWSGSPLGAIGEINLTTHAISYYPVSTTAGTTWAITAGPDGNVWFTTYNQTSYIGEINPTTHAISYFPAATAKYMYITAGSDGNLWFTTQGSAEIGDISPTTDAVTEYPLAAGTYGYAITAGPDGNIWFTEPSVGEIGEFNLTTDAASAYPIPYTGTDSTVITAGPDGNLWFADVGTNAIGVAYLTSSSLVVTQQPPSFVTAGSAFGLTVEAENSSGNPITSFDGTVTVALASNPGGATLGGTVTATASNGVATFSGLTITTAASGYTLEASASGLAAANTTAITVTPAAATQLVITTQPPATVKVSTAFGFQASIEDQYGNVVTTASNMVSVAFANNPTGVTLGGTLSVAASQGVATFSGLTINKTGSGYTLEVTSNGLSSAVTSAINVTKTGNSGAIVSQGGINPPDSLLAPLVLDSSDLWDIPGLKKHARST